jgi:hypothetical protein
MPMTSNAFTPSTRTSSLPLDGMGEGYFPRQDGLNLGSTDETLNKARRRVMVQKVFCLRLPRATSGVGHWRQARAVSFFCSPVFRRAPEVRGTWLRGGKGVAQPPKRRVTERSPRPSAWCQAARGLLLAG